MKAGLLDKRHARRFALTSAWAELLGYCGNVALNALRISAALEREHALAQELLRRKKARLYFFCLGFGKTAFCLRRRQQTASVCAQTLANATTRLFGRCVMACAAVRQLHDKVIATAVSQHAMI